jgi:predicted nucleic acid-binding protein
MARLENSKFFLDTYAMVEYLRGSKAYKPYFENTTLFTSMLNLIELYYVLLRESDDSAADSAYLAFRTLQATITDEDVKQAMRFRLRQRSQRVDFSYADSVGYEISRRLGAKYLTGDSSFKSLVNVEFVK